VGVIKLSGSNNELLNWESNFKNAWPYSGQINIKTGGLFPCITCYIYYSEVKRPPVFLPFIHHIGTYTFNVKATMY